MRTVRLLAGIATVIGVLASSTPAYPQGTTAASWHRCSGSYTYYSPTYRQRYRVDRFEAWKVTCTKAKTIALQCVRLSELAGKVRCPAGWYSQRHGTGWRALWVVRNPYKIKGGTGWRVRAV